ncbi:hypothetical protein K3495_g12832 [Podosphaera aphanis]|nr:hypothetical protein K3495_g12832 [Podosphaera aphanis]
MAYKKISEVYPYACRLILPHNYYDEVNVAERRNIRGRVFEGEDGVTDVIEKWEFVDLLDVHNQDGFHYLVKWKHQRPLWQPETDLGERDEALIKFHKAHPEKPDPPSWVKLPRKQPSILDDKQKGEKIIGVRRSERLKHFDQSRRQTTDGA